VRLAALADAPDAFASTLSVSAAPSPSGAPGSGLALVPGLARQDARLLVAAVLRSARQRLPPAADPPARDPRGWHLVSMWVSPQVRGTGVAELLIGAVVDHAWAVGAPRITLWVALGNARARAFYLRMGFTPTGRRQAYPRDGADALDEEELARPVRSAAPPTAPP
jgi:ribosomal protein S18 acetylase RimI-like enzyme